MNNFKFCFMYNLFLAISCVGSFTALVLLDKAKYSWVPIMFWFFAFISYKEK